jgi:hypothetical protein
VLLSRLMAGFLSFFVCLIRFCCCLIIKFSINRVQSAKTRPCREKKQTNKPKSSPVKIIIDSSANWSIKTIIYWMERALTETCMRGLKSENGDDWTRKMLWVKKRWNRECALYNVRKSRTMADQEFRRGHKIPQKRKPKN